MADFNCDTERLREDSKEIQRLINDYQKQINDFFKELNNLSIDGVWQGNNANRYIDNASGDKQMYVTYGQGLSDISDFMLDYADKLEGKVKNVEDNF